MAGIICPKCQTPNDASTLMCRNCGGALSTLETALLEKRDFQGYTVLERLAQQDETGFAYLVEKRDQSGERLIIRDTQLLASEKTELKKEIEGIVQKAPQTRLLSVSEGHCYTLEPVIEEAKAEEASVEEAPVPEPDPCPNPRCNGSIDARSNVCPLCHTERGATGEDIWLRTVVLPALESDYLEAARDKIALIACAAEYGLTVERAEEIFDRTFEEETGLSVADSLPSEPLAETEETAEETTGFETRRLQVSEAAEAVTPASEEDAIPDVVSDPATQPVSPAATSVIEEPPQTAGAAAARVEETSAPAAKVEEAVMIAREEKTPAAVETAPPSEVRKEIAPQTTPLSDSAETTEKRTWQIPIGRFVIYIAAAGIIGFAGYFIWQLRPPEFMHIPLHPSEPIYRKEIKDFQNELKGRICQMVDEAQSEGNFTEARRTRILNQIVKEKAELERISKLSVELSKDDILRLIGQCEGKPQPLR